MATSGDYLRLWKVSDNDVRQECMLNNVRMVLAWDEHLLIIVYLPPTQNKNSEFCAPLTSFDWNETDPNILGASSIDTTCTIWGLEV